jgi:hypothetical protein
MNIYKFKDTVDGNYAFILADNSYDAEMLLETKTSLEFELVEAKPISDIYKPIIIKNNIVPF